MDCHSLLQGIFPTQGLNPALSHCRWILYHLSQQGVQIFDTSIVPQGIYTRVSVCWLYRDFYLEKCWALASKPRWELYLETVRSRVYHVSDVVSPRVCFDNWKPLWPGAFSMHHEEKAQACFCPHSLGECWNFLFSLWILEGGVHLCGISPREHCHLGVVHQRRPGSGSSSCSHSRPDPTHGYIASVMVNCELGC